MARGRQTTFHCTHRSQDLEYIRSAKRLTTRQARWSMFFSRFDFHVTYRPGSKNGKADALLRQFDFAMSSKVPNEPVIPTSLILAPVQWDIITEITDAQANDPQNHLTAHRNKPMFLQIFDNASYG